MSAAQVFAAGSLALLVASAPVVVRLEEALHLSPPQSAEVVASLAQSIGRITDGEVAIDDFTVCGEDRDCVADIASRFGASQVVLLRLAGGVSKGRAAVTLATPELGAQRRVEIDFPLDDRADWPALFGAVATILFPRAVERARPIEHGPPPKIEERPDPLGAILSWTAIGTGVALGGVAAGLRVSAENVRGDAEALAHDDAGRSELEDRSNAHGLASNLLFGAAAVAVASGVVYLLTH